MGSKTIKTQNNLTNVNPNAVILHSNIIIEKEDIPASHFWTEEELTKFRQDPNYFVSIMGNVYKNDKDYAFKKMQRRLKKNRDFYKYTGQRIDSELLTEIDRLIKEKENEK